MGTWTFLAPIFPTTQFDLGAYQVLIADPLSPYGLTLTGATHLHVLPVPATAIYVSASSGAAGNPGTQAAPLQTISAGIAASQARFPRPPVFVMAGTYTETLVISNAISVHGGLDSGTWAFTGGRSIVNAGTTPVSVIVNQGPSVISGFDFRASPAAAPGAASIACRIEFANGQHFENCRFVAQSGGPGATGGAGATGGSGNAGSYGCPFGCESIWYQSALFGLGGQGARPGGAGGDGGIYANSALWNGQPGQAAPFGGGGGGPASAIQGFPPNNGASAPGAGQPGAPGGAGSHGQAGLPGGSVFSGVWSPGGGRAAPRATSGSAAEAAAGAALTRASTGTVAAAVAPAAEADGGGAGGGSGGASIAVQVFGGDPVFTRVRVRRERGRKRRHGRQRRRRKCRRSRRDEPRQHRSARRERRGRRCGRPGRRRRRRRRRSELVRPRFGPLDPLIPDGLHLHPRHGRFRRGRRSARRCCILRAVWTPRTHGHRRFVLTPGTRAGRSGSQASPQGGRDVVDYLGLRSRGLRRLRNVGRFSTQSIEYRSISRPAPSRSSAAIKVGWNQSAGVASSK